MSAHSPGPWFVTSEDDRPTGSVGTSPLSNDIALTWSETCAKADARLIAAAPELLAIVSKLALLREGLENGSSSAEHAATRLALDAVAVVAKATGGAA